MKSYESLDMIKQASMAIKTPGFAPMQVEPPGFYMQ